MKSGMNVSVRTGLAKAATAKGEVGVCSEPDPEGQISELAEAMITLTLPVNRGIWDGERGDLTTSAQVLVSFTQDGAEELVIQLQNLIREAARKNSELGMAERHERTNGAEE